MQADDDDDIRVDLRTVEVWFFWLSVWRENELLIRPLT